METLNQGDIVRVGMMDRLGVIIGPVMIEGVRKPRVGYLTVHFSRDEAGHIQQRFSRLPRRSHKKFVSVTSGELEILDIVVSFQKALRREVSK